MKRRHMIFEEHYRFKFKNIFLGSKSDFFGKDDRFSRNCSLKIGLRLAYYG